MNLRNKWATHESNTVQSMNNLRWADEISAEILCITRDLNINMSIFCWWCRQFWSVFQNCFWSEATGAVKNLYRIWWLTHEAIFCFFFASFGLFRLSRYFPLYWYQSFREMGNLPEKLFSYISIDFYFVAATFMVHFLVFLRNDSGDEDLWTKLEFNNCQWHDASFKLSSLKQRQLTYSDRNQKKKNDINTIRLAFVHVDYNFSFNSLKYYTAVSAIIKFQMERYTDHCQYQKKEKKPSLISPWMLSRFNTNLCHSYNSDDQLL